MLQASLARRTAAAATSSNAAQQQPKSPLLRGMAPSASSTFSLASCDTPLRTEGDGERSGPAAGMNGHKSSGGPTTANNRSLLSKGMGSPNTSSMCFTTGSEDNVTESPSACCQALLAAKKEKERKRAVQALASLCKQSNNGGSVFSQLASRGTNSNGTGRGGGGGGPAHTRKGDVAASSPPPQPSTGAPQSSKNSRRHHQQQDPHKKKPHHTHLLVVDFECTCDSGEPNYPHEIIEFPVVVVDVALRRVVAEFHTYIRPVNHPILSPFCKELTGITQEQVDAAPTLPEAIAKFDDWCVEVLVPIVQATAGKLTTPSSPKEGISPLPPSSLSVGEEGATPTPSSYDPTDNAAGCSDDEEGDDDDTQRDLASDCDEENNEVEEGEEEGVPSSVSDSDCSSSPPPVDDRKGPATRSAKYVDPNGGDDESEEADGLGSALLTPEACSALLLQHCLFVTDGPSDLRHFMYQCHVLRDGHTDVFSPLFFRWSNVRKVFADHYKTRPETLLQMLRRMGLTFHGQHHCGLDDSRNIARIVIGLLQRGKPLRQTSSIPYLSGKLMEEERRSSQLLAELLRDDEEEKSSSSKKNKKKCSNNNNNNNSKGDGGGNKAKKHPPPHRQKTKK